MHLRLLLLLTCWLAVLPAQGDVDRAGLEARRAELQIEGESLERLLSVSKAAEEAGDRDLALWLAQRAWAFCVSGKPKPQDLKAVAKIVDRLDPMPAAERPTRDQAGKICFELARACAARKLYANAVDYYEACRGTASWPKAERNLQKQIFGRKKVLEALIGAGVPVSMRSRVRKSARWIARHDASHATWEKRTIVKTANYTVETNAGWQLANDVAVAMEQMNRAYRDIFRHKRQGGGTARCLVKIYRTKEEFQQREDADSAGFYSPSGNFVATYDPRPSDEPISELWSTLFHEASHQFTTMIWPTLTPGWLDEGTSSYFEGARLLPTGKVQTNLIEPTRLENLLITLKEGSPTVREVLRYFQPGSYSADYYCVGWGMVYFLLNYEDEKSRKVYRPIYDAYVDAYRSGGKHEPLKRFEDFFVKKAKQPGIKTLDDFEKRFADWIRALGDVEFGGPDKADILIARARKQLENGRKKEAVVSYRRALQKRPGDLAASNELADLLLAIGQKDAALANLRGLLVSVRDRGEEKIPELGGQTGDEVVAGVFSRIERTNRGVGKLLRSGADELLGRIDKAVKTYEEAGLPRAALGALDLAIELRGPLKALKTERRRIAEASAVDVWVRKRFVFRDDDVTPWLPDGPFRFDQERMLADGRKETAVITLESRDLPDTYRLETTVEPDIPEGPGLVGIKITVGRNDDWHALVVDAAGGVTLVRVDDEWHDLKKLAKPAKEKRKSLHLAIEVAPGEVRYFLDGRHLHTRPYATDEAVTAPGLMASGGAATFSAICVGE